MIPDVNSMFILFSVWQVSKKMYIFMKKKGADQNKNVFFHFKDFLFLEKYIFRLFINCMVLN